MNIQTLKKNILLAKKEGDKNLSLAYGAILKQVEKVTIGVVKKEVVDTTKTQDEIENDLIVAGATKELKEQKESKLAFEALPKEKQEQTAVQFSAETIALCEKIISEFGHKTMTERETEMAIENTILNLGLENPTIKQMGQIMGSLVKEYGADLDKGLASEVIRKKLS